jgi:hypothetical protein
LGAEGNRLKGEVSFRRATKADLRKSRRTPTEQQFADGARQQTVRDRFSVHGIRAQQGETTALGLKIPALKSRLHRARLALRQRLENSFEADAEGLRAPALPA